MGVLGSKKRTQVLDILLNTYPEAECALEHKNLFQLIVAVALSAQTTDKSVNSVSDKLFGKYPDAKALKNADDEELMATLKPVGMYKTKSKNIKALASMLDSEYGGEVPQDYDALVKLPGVGRKTANVVLSVGFGEQRIAVDTHVFRVANRIGLCHEKDVLKTELALMKNLPKNRWSQAHHLLIWHGRRCCSARKPSCEICPISGYCQTFNA